MHHSLHNLAISPSGFVFDPQSGATFSVNPTARLLLEGIRDGLGLDALVLAVQGQFETYGEDLRRDALEFTRLLQDQGLLPREFELE